MDYITRVSVELNGQVFDDFSAFTENSVTLTKQVNLMRKTGTAKMTPRYGFTLDWVKASIPAGVDPRKIYRKTFTVEEENGNRVTFGGVSVAETGDASVDGENEITQTVTYIAESRTPDLEL